MSDVWREVPDLALGLLIVLGLAITAYLGLRLRNLRPLPATLTVLLIFAGFAAGVLFWELAPSARSPSIEPDARTTTTTTTTEAAAVADAMNDKASSVVDAAKADASAIKDTTGKKADALVDAAKDKASAMKDDASKAVDAMKDQAKATKVESALADLRRLPIRFNVPAKLPWKRSLIKLVVASKSVPAAEQSVRLALGEVNAAEVKLSLRVKAELSGPSDDIEIIPEKTSIKAISGERNVEWRWWVRPLKPGPVDLVLSMYNIVKISDGDAEFEYTAFEKTIPVEMSKLDSLRYYILDYNPLIVALTAILGTIVGAIIWLRNRLEKPPGPTRISVEFPPSQSST